MKSRSSAHGSLLTEIPYCTVYRSTATINCRQKPVTLHRGFAVMVFLRNTYTTTHFFSKRPNLFISEQSAPVPYVACEHLNNKTTFTKIICHTHDNKQTTPYEDDVKKNIKTLPEDRNSRLPRKVGTQWTNNTASQVTGHTWSDLCLIRGHPSKIKSEAKGKRLSVHQYVHMPSARGKQVLLPQTQKIS